MSSRGPEIWTKGRLKSPADVADEIITAAVERAKNPPDTRLYNCGGLPVELTLPDWRSHGRLGVRIGDIIHAGRRGA